MAEARNGEARKGEAPKGEARTGEARKRRTRKGDQRAPMPRTESALIVMIIRVSGRPLNCG
jgi:hypothetical protein